MRKLSLLMTVAAMLIAAPSVLASSAAGRACKGSKAQRQIGLRVHNLSCQAASKSLSTGSGYNCKTAGQTKMIPYTIKCVSRKHKSTFYSYLFYGG